MSRKRGSPDDPTPQFVMGVEGTDMIPKILSILNPREAAVIAMRFGLRDGQPKTLSEVGKSFGVSRERIRVIESEALRRLHDPSVSSALVVMDGDEAVGFVDARLTGADRSQPDPDIELVTCPQCSQRQFLAKIPTSPRGRTRSYCSNSCRQAAYRARRRITDEAH